MSDPIDFINPSAPTISSPVGIDAVIQSLQLAYTANLSWLEKSFGRAFIMSRPTDEQTNLISRQDYIYPGLWQGSGSDMIDGMANDNLNAYSFFVKEGNEEPINYNQRSDNLWSVEFSNIFWFNLKRVDSTKTYPFNEELLEQVKGIISNTSFSLNRAATVEIIRIYEKPQEIFDNFTIDLAKTQHLNYPHGGFRILMRAIYTESCA